MRQKSSFSLADVLLILVSERMVKKPLSPEEGFQFSRMRGSSCGTAAGGAKMSGCLGERRRLSGPVQVRLTLFRAVCVIGVGLVSYWEGMLFLGEVSASSTIGYREIYMKLWTPPLPVVPNTFVVEESSLTPFGRHIQFLRPNEQFLVLIVNPTAITVMPSSYQEEAYDVDDGRCDLVSLQTYREIFDKAPAGYEFWRVQDHHQPSITSTSKNSADPAAAGQNQSISVRSLLFTAPSKRHIDDDSEEFCIIARENKQNTQRRVSMIVVVRSAAQQILITSGLSFTLMTSVIGLSRSC